MPTGEGLQRVLHLLRPQPAESNLLLALADRSFAERQDNAKAFGMPLTLGQMLRAIRFRVGKSQSEVANRIGVRQSTVAKWERDSVRPGPDLVGRVLSAYGATETERQFLLELSPSMEITSQEYGERLDAIDLMPAPLQEVAYMAFEMELWPKAMRDTKLLRLLVGSSSVRANLLMEQGRLREIAPLIRQILGQVKAHGFWREGSLGYYSYLAAEHQFGSQPAALLKKKMESYSQNIPELPNRYFVEGLFGSPRLSMQRAEELKALAPYDSLSCLKVWPYELDIGAAYALMSAGDPESAIALLLPYFPDPTLGSHSFLADSISRVLCRAYLSAGIIPPQLDQILAHLPRDRYLESTQNEWKLLERGFMKLRNQGAPDATP